MKFSDWLRGPLSPEDRFVAALNLAMMIVIVCYIAARIIILYHLL